MIEMSAEIRAWLVREENKIEPEEDEYIDPADGLLHCKKCGGQRQTVVPRFGKPGYFMPRCICPCQKQAIEQRKADEERQHRMERIRRRKAQGLQDRYLYDYTFANDNGQNPLTDKAHSYVEHWEQAYRQNIGLLLFGDVGTGKSFFAGCIANALLEKDVPVLMTNFPTILNRLTGMFSEDRTALIAALSDYDLLIIDDLGAERNTDYAMEQMFFIIDSRYRSRKPMIITTFWNAAPRSSFPGRTSGRKMPVSQRRWQRSLYPMNEAKINQTIQYLPVMGRQSEKGAYIPMSSENMNPNAAQITASENPPALVKKIGKTTYIVRIHFSETSTETMSDKIKRMIQNEIRQM